MAGATMVTNDFDALETASGDAPYILDEQDLEEAAAWVITDIPLAGLKLRSCKEALPEREKRLQAVRNVPQSGLFRPIFKGSLDGSLTLIDGGHRIEVAAERGLDRISALVKLDFVPSALQMDEHSCVDLVMNSARAAVDEFRRNGEIVKARAQGLDFDFSVRAGGVTLDHIGVDAGMRGTGTASRALGLLTSIADKHGVTLDLEVGSDEAEIDLVAWYARHGFAWSKEGNVMIREPRAEVQLIAAMTGPVEDQVDEAVWQKSATERLKMKREKLKHSSEHSCAAQCREMNIVVGDTIVGRETYSTGQWSEAKLTALFIGNEAVVFKTMRRSHDAPCWRSDGESANWTLEHRDWSKLLPKARDTAVNSELSTEADSVAEVGDDQEETARSGQSPRGG